MFTFHTPYAAWRAAPRRCGSCRQPITQARFVWVAPDDYPRRVIGFLDRYL